MVSIDSLRFENRINSVGRLSTRQRSTNFDLLLATFVLALEFSLHNSSLLPSLFALKLEPSLRAIQNLKNGR